MPACLHRFAREHCPEQIRIDVAAGRDQPDRLPMHGGALPQCSGQAGRARTFDHVVGVPEIDAHRFRNLIIVDSDDPLGTP